MSHEGRSGRGGGGGDTAAADRSIYAHVVAHLRPDGSGLLDGGETLPDEDAGDPDTIRWAAGALDGVFTHHVGVGVGGAGDDEHEAADLLFDAVWTAVRGDLADPEFDALYALVSAAGSPTTSVLELVDVLLERIRASSLPPATVHELGRRLALESAHRNPVKLGIALLGLFDLDDGLRDAVVTLARHEEFTLYAAVALGNDPAGREHTLWALARGVTGWGRIHLVERLAETENPRIKDWILREGFRNSVMNEYLAYIAATTGGLVDALSAAEVDRELLRAAGDVIDALIDGGPAQDLDDYADGATAVELYLGHLTARVERAAHDGDALELTDLLTAESVRAFLDESGADWSTRELRGWTPEHRATLRARCGQILTWPGWRERAVAGLRSDDRTVFFTAERAARVVGVPTLPAHLRRLGRDPLEAASWSGALRDADETTIDQLVELAIRALPLADLAATGPGTDIGLGPGYEADRCLDYIVQDLGRWPGRGWPLVATALTNRVVRSRNMAVRTLRAWPRSAWPARAEAALREAAEREVNDDVRARMHRLLLGEPEEPDG